MPLAPASSTTKKAQPMARKINHSNPHFDEIVDPVAAAAESAEFHRLFGTEADGNHQRSAYSDGRDISGTWGTEGANRHGDKLGDGSADEMSREGARMLADLEHSTRSAERGGR